MSTQSTTTDTENPSDESGSAYGELLATSSLAELDEKSWNVKLALLKHHQELVRIFVGELLEEEVEEKAGKRYKHDNSPLGDGERIREASASVRRSSRLPSRACGIARLVKPSLQNATVR